MAKLRKQKTEDNVEVVEAEKVEISGEIEPEEKPKVKEEEKEESLDEIEKGEKPSGEKLDIIDNAVTKAKAQEADVVENKVVKEPQVRINPKQDIRSHIGDQWYNLKAGKIVSVPRTVKVKLERAGMLNPV